MSQVILGSFDLQLFRSLGGRFGQRKKAVGVTGLAMTKLDGTARGGILVAIAAKFHMPVHYIGVGEGLEDLAPFSARDFARAIAGLPPTPS